MTTPTLTPRELEVLQLASNGLEDSAIAKTLGMGVQTVKTRMNFIRLKLDASNRTEAACRAIREGIIK